jgi:hypothetical protein
VNIPNYIPGNGHITSLFIHMNINIWFAAGDNKKHCNWVQMKPSESVVNSRCSTNEFPLQKT